MNELMRPSISSSFSEWLDTFGTASDCAKELEDMRVNLDLKR
jgi:hypothetical protein